MNTKAKNIIAFMLFVILFSGLRGARYFFDNRLQEVGLLFLVIIYIYGAYSTAIRVPNKSFNWNFWAISPLVFIACTVFLPAFLFSKYNNVPMMPSIMASRELLFIFVLPSLIFLYRLGYPFEYFEKIIIFTLIFITVMYLILSKTMPLETWYFSADRYKSSLVATDSWRGFRLHAPVTALQIGFLLFIFKVIYTEKNRSLWILLFVLSVWALFTYNSRSLLAALPLSVLFYFIFFRNNYHYPLFLVCTPLLILLLIYIGNEFFDLILQQNRDGSDTRLPMYRIAFNSIEDKPLFGMGMSSFFSLTDEQIFKIPFFAVDIGIVGIAYRYGLVGAFLYIFSVLFLFIYSVKTKYLYNKLNIVNNVFIPVFICRLFGDIFKYILSVDYVFGHGLVLASLIIFFNLTLRERLYSYSRQRTV